MRNFVEIQDEKIIFDRGFFNRAFIDSSIAINKPLRSLSLRIMAILLQELSFYQEKKLPPRNELAKKLGVSTTAVNNSLVELEESGFLIRVISELEKIIVIDEAEKEHQEFLNAMEKQKKINREAKRFSDYFRINYFFNQTASERAIDLYEELEKYIRKDLKDEELTKLLKGWNYEQAIIEEIIKIYNEKNN